MFSAIESTWDQSARRGWTTLASFTLQAMGLSLLLLIPILMIQGPPRLQWLESPTLIPPPAPAPAPRQQRSLHSLNLSGEHLLQPPSIPLTVAELNEAQVGTAPDVGDIGAVGGTGTSRRNILGALGPSVEVAPPPVPAPSHPMRISQGAEANLIHRVQPVYPPIARQVRVQGAVELRAIISKAGTIENLVVLRGHPMLAAAASEAVRQWRYRPYLLNNEPVEVETDITVNFVLSGD